MFYSKSTGGFYVVEIHGENMPSDVVEISEEQYQALMAAQSQGKHLTADDRGYPIAIEPPAIPVEALRAQVQSELRVLRDPVLVRVVQIGLIANVTGNSALSAEVFAEPGGIRRQLLDVIEAPGILAGETYEEMRSAAMTAFKLIADTASSELKSAFK